MEKIRTIHVKGMGTASMPPDYVTITLKLVAKHREYACVMQIGSEQVELLREAVVTAGFGADELKTVKFSVDSEYESEEYEENGRTRYQQVFIGYECHQTLRLSFDLDRERLTQAMTAIESCTAKPEASIAFTVKDIRLMRDCIMESAAEDAHRKADILCKSSGVKLGNLLRIEYSWSKVESDSTIDIPLWISKNKKELPSYIQPDDVKGEDTVDFIWEIC